MKAFTEYQNQRIITKEGTVANGDYTLEEVTVRIKDGLLHNGKDELGRVLPAIATHDFTHIEYWENGQLHNDNGPAIKDTVDNYEMWFKHGIEIHPNN